MYVMMYVAVGISSLVAGGCCCLIKLKNGFKKVKENDKTTFICVHFSYRNSKSNKQIKSIILHLYFVCHQTVIKIFKIHLM